VLGELLHKADHSFPFLQASQLGLQAEPSPLLPLAALLVEMLMKVDDSFLELQEQRAYFFVN
jgi:hypothetical protein